MGSKFDVARAYISAAWSNPPESLVEAAGTYLSDDFQVLDPDGNVVMNREAFLGMSQLLMAAFKDFNVVYSDMHDGDDGLVTSYHFEGTHTGDLDMSVMGMGIMPASGKKIVWAEATNKWKVEGGKIVAEVGISGSGISAFLTPLGL